MNAYQNQLLNSFIKILLVFSFIFLNLQNTFSQERTVEKAGDVLFFALPATALGTTLIIGDKKGAWQFTKAFLVNGVLTYSLKSIIKKERPDGSNNNSFPSGHTSVTFQSASFIQRRYGWKYGAPAYLLAGFTGYSRVNADKHDIVDVVAGAVIGIGSTYLFTTPYQQEHMELSFTSSNDTYLIGFKFKF